MYNQAPLHSGTQIELDNRSGPITFMWVPGSINRSTSLGSLKLGSAIRGIPLRNVNWYGCNPSSHSGSHQKLRITLKIGVVRRQREVYSVPNSELSTTNSYNRNIGRVPKYSSCFTADSETRLTWDPESRRARNIHQRRHQKYMIRSTPNAGTRCGH